MTRIMAIILANRGEHRHRSVASFGVIEQPGCYEIMSLHAGRSESTKSGRGGILSGHWMREKSYAWTATAAATACLVVLSTV